MQLTTRTSNALLQHTNDSDVQVASGGACEIIYVNNFFLEPETDPLPNHVSIEDVMAIFEDNESGRESMKSARRWVGESFYDDGNPATLKSIRLSKGLSQKQLAEAIDSKQSYIARLEGGNSENIYLATFRKLSLALEIDMDELSQALENS